MTLIATLINKDSIWLLADRRLTYGSGAIRDDAQKILLLECTDGVAILGYAGLGSTAGQTEPSDWMSRVLRGRNWPLEPSLNCIADAMQVELPRHLRALEPNRISPHHVVAAAFRGETPSLFTIGIATTPEPGRYLHRRTWWDTDNPGRPPPRTAVAGSGIRRYLAEHDLEIATRKASAAHDAGRVSALAVADRFAALNYAVHLREPSVGPNCIVAWRYRQSGVHGGGGGHQAYVGKSRDTRGISLPMIGQGTDLRQLSTIAMPFFSELFERHSRGETDATLDRDAVNAAMELGRWTPDEKLS